MEHAPHAASAFCCRPLLRGRGYIAGRRFFVAASHRLSPPLSDSVPFLPPRLGRLGSRRHHLLSARRDATPIIFSSRPGAVSPIRTVGGRASTFNQEDAAPEVFHPSSVLFMAFFNECAASNFVRV